VPRAQAIEPATSADTDAVRALLLEYAEALGVDLCFQGFDRELAELPGEYAPPRGSLLVARDEHGDAAGCVALRRLSDGTCEMKRLYVRPALRGAGLGRELALAVVEEARGLGYARMRLDTLPSMSAAARLYESLGFLDIEPYYENPVPGARYLELEL
jgi:putative acetyltransferase